MHHLILCTCSISFFSHYFSLTSFGLTEIFFFFLLSVFVFCFLGAPLSAYGSSQARGRIGVTAASLHHSHSNVGSEPFL